MSEPSKDGMPQLKRWVFEEWASRLGGAIESMTEQKPPTECLFEDEDVSDLLGAFWYELPLSLGKGTSLLAAAPESTWQKLGAFVLSSVGLTDPEPVNVRNTYVEMLSLATSSLAQAMAAKLGRGVSYSSGMDLDSAPDAVEVVTVMLELDGQRYRMFLGASEALEEVFRAAEEAAKMPPPAPKSPERPAGTGGGGAAAATAPAVDPNSAQMKNFDLLLDVELPVGICFGRTTLQLRDVLKLTTGSIVELNRTITEPVELVINGKVIARGEVVVVEGNYGLRVNQIISRQERLRSIR